MGNFIKACPTSQVKESEGKLVNINGIPVAIFNINGDFFAVNNICSHAGGPLCEGHVEDGIVSCPWHGWEFDIKTGECQMIPTKGVQKYEIKVEGDYVFVKI